MLPYPNLRKHFPDLTSADSSLSIDEPGAYGVLLLGDAGVTLLSEDVGLPGQAVSDPDSV